MKKNDLILIGALLVFAFTILLGQRLWQRNNTTDNAEVVITIDGVETQRLPLNKDEELTIQIDDEESNVLVIKDGQASITDATCPDRICVRHNSIRYDGESIVCLPHKVVVSIDGGQKLEVDTIAQ